jgi:thioredoxin 1
MPVYNITSLEEFQSLLKLPNLIVFKVFANWCGPCQAYKPQFEQLSNQYGDGIIFIEADVANNFVNVTSLPATLFIKNNQIVDKIIGIDLPLLQQKIRQYA